MIRKKKETQSKPIQVPCSFVITLSPKSKKLKRAYTWNAETQEMAFLLPNLSQSLLLQNNKSKEKPIFHQSLTHSSKPISTFTLSTTTSLLQTPPTVEKSSGAQDNGPKDAQDKQKEKDDFYVNLGLAVRTLREDIPQIFTKDLNYDIYR